MTMSATALSSVERHRTFQAMQKHGGGFCAALAAAWFLGDAHNRARIELAFPHLLDQFGPGSSIITRIQQFLEYANVGDEICLTTHGSVDQGTGLLLGLGADGLYLVDSGAMAPLGIYDAAVAAAAAEEWAADTGATLWEDITS